VWCLVLGQFVYLVRRGVGAKLISHWLLTITGEMEGLFANSTFMPNHSVDICC